MFDFLQTLSVRGINGKAMIVDGSKWSEEFVTYMLQYAWDVKRQRSTASADDKEEAQRKVIAGMTAGAVPTKGAGSSADPTSTIDHKWLISVGVKGKKADLTERWMSVARTTVLNSVPEELKASLLKDAGELTKIASENLQKVQEKARQSDSWLKVKSELEKKPIEFNLNIEL